MTKSIPKIDVVCQQCGKPFKTWNYKLKNGRGKFCSKECFYISHRKEKPTRICKQCGKEFETRQSYINYGQEPKYCSQKCLHESQKKRVAIKCPICEKIFYDRPSKIKEVDQIFCSNECYRKSISMRTSGPNNHNWIGGISFDPYCIKFNNNFKERVRSFFNYTCVECGNPQGETKLHVHHVNYHKNACCDKNITPLFVALCRPCHTATNYKRDYWENHFTKIINEQYGGNCYLPKVIA